VGELHASPTSRGAASAILMAHFSHADSVSPDRAPKPNAAETVDVGTGARRGDFTYARDPKGIASSHFM
jgi:hypothetical protein